MVSSIPSGAQCCCPTSLRVIGNTFFTSGCPVHDPSMIHRPQPNTVTITISREDAESVVRDLPEASADFAFGRVALACRAALKAERGDCWCRGCQNDEPCRTALEEKPKKSPLRPEPPRRDPGQDVTKATPKPVSESEDSVTITITREQAEEILGSEYGCSECNGIAEPLIAAVRTTLEGREQKLIMSRRRVLICGGRDYHDRAKVDNTLRAYLEDGDIVIHGGAPGADALSGDVAGRVLGHTVEVFPANWSRHGSAAGPIRNQEMLASGIDLVIAFDGGRGTEDMVKRASKAGVEVITVSAKR